MEESRLLLFAENVAKGILRAICFQRGHTVSWTAGGIDTASATVPAGLHRCETCGDYVQVPAEVPN